MTWSSPAFASVVFVLGFWSTAVGQIETAQLHGIVTTATPVFVGAGLGVGWRNAGRFGVLVAGSVGPADRRFAYRVEAMAIFHVSPASAGLGVYGAGGVAVAHRRSATNEFLLLVIGIERNPRGSRGWFAEIGVGGGGRLSAGFRIRRPQQQLP